MFAARVPLAEGENAGREFPTVNAFSSISYVPSFIVLTITPGATFIARDFGNCGHFCRHLLRHQTFCVYVS